MQRSRKILVILLILGITGFGYSQYAAASNIGVTITQSELMETAESDSTYRLQLQFDNPSLLYLTAGETEFVISMDGKVIGQGTLEPFILPGQSTAVTDGTFQTHSNIKESQHVPKIKINGVTQYDMGITSVDVPFVFEPTEEQAREFIHRG